MLLLRIISIIEETKDCKTFYVKPVNGQPLIYKAGQFLTLLIEHGGKTVRRSYSFGSAPRVDEHPYFTVKRKVNGEISRHLLDHYKEGEILTSLEPAGRFVLQQSLSSTYLFIAAGSGIVPVLSLIKSLLAFHAETKIILINQCRSEDEIIYKDQLIALQQIHKERFWVEQFFSRPNHHKHPVTRLNNTRLEAFITKHISHNNNATFYLCGPLPFMRMAQFTIKLMGFADGQIMKEQFVIEPPLPPPLLNDTSQKEVVIHYKNTTHRLQIAYPQNILDAALLQGIALPYSCKAGICSTCMATCIKGEIIMSNNEVLTEKDLAKNLILTCVGYAKTDVEIIV